jgi:hypothetical protein
MELYILDVLRTSISAKTKRIQAQLGSVTGRIAESFNAQWMQHIGLVSRPPKPVAGKTAARAVVFRRGNTDVVISSEDDRGLALMGQLADGETCLYAAGEDGEAQARILLKKNGSINLYTREGNTSSGAGMIIQIDAENDAIRITNSLGYGLIIDPDGVSITTGSSGGALTIGADGKCSLIATGRCQVDGTTILLGSNPAMVPGVASVCVGPAGIAAIPSTKVLASVA